MERVVRKLNLAPFLIESSLKYGKAQGHEGLTACIEAASERFIRKYESKPKRLPNSKGNGKTLEPVSVLIDPNIAEELEGVGKLCQLEGFQATLRRALVEYVGFGAKISEDDYGNMIVTAKYDRKDPDLEISRVATNTVDPFDSYRTPIKINQKSS